MGFVLSPLLLFRSVITLEPPKGPGEIKKWMASLDITLSIHIFKRIGVEATQ